MKKNRIECLKERFAGNWQNILISFVAGMIGGAILGALFWLISGKNKSHIASWLSTVGTFSAVFVSLYLSSRNDESHKEEIETMKLPYFRIDADWEIPLPSLFDKKFNLNDENLLNVIDSLKDKMVLSVKILNIVEVETLLNFKMVVRLGLVSTDNKNKRKNEGYIYCLPIKEISASLGESKYTLTLTGTREEQVEQLKKCYFLSELTFNETIVSKVCKAFYNKMVKDSIKYPQLCLMPLSFKDYINEIEYHQINKNSRKFFNNYSLEINNIYISCKTVLGTEVFYEYDSETGETYYRADKKEIYAGSEISKLTLEADMAGLQREIKRNNSFVKQDVPIRNIGHEMSDKVEAAKRRKIKQIYEEEYKKLHDKLNEIRENNGMRTFMLEEVRNGWSVS